MSHVDSLRDMAKDLPIGGGMVAVRPHQDALTALDRVRDAWAVWERGSDEQGRSDAYRHAHTIITRAIGDTP